MSKDSDLLQIAKKDPLTAARLCQNEVTMYEKGVRERLHYFIAVGYAIGHTLARDYKEWQVFKNSSFWGFRKKRLKNKDQQHAHLHAMVFVFSATTSQLYDRAWKYAVAVEPFWEKGAKPQEVLNALRKVGVEELLKQSLEIRAQRKKERQEKWGDHIDTYLADLFEKPVSPAEGMGDNAESDTASVNNTEEDPPKRPRSKAHTGDQTVVDGSGEEKSSAEQRKKAKLLRLTASRAVRKQVRGLAAGEKARLTIKRVEGQPGKVRVVSFKKIAS
ncbi:hypothetical protein [Microvirga arabica]|uniref:hypothetical protein n=1 Tax=Microvirga arabica TaxID=1128671 RepID=UPI001939A58B|nr:hypothetical protein [Microvirga arabica]MBM1174564.1 hypothetical protein [Microvirga arabica]